ncbi:MAG: hypothetical protein RJA13_727, partial [Bacteroidota bacterium]
QGNQLTKLKVKEIVVVPQDENEEQWPEELNQVEISEVEMDDEEEDSDEATDGTTVEWDLTKKDDEDEEQMKLF